MELLFYFYTILIMIVCIAAAAVDFSAFFASHRRSFLFLAAFFVFYFADLALIFEFEYVGQNVPFSLDHFYAINLPIVRTLLAVGSLESLWLLICDFFDARNTLLLVAPAVVFVVASAAVVGLMPEGPFTQWLFYTLRQFFLIWTVAYCAWRYLREDDEVERTRMRRHITLFVIVCIFIVLIMVEDYLMIIAWTPEDATTPNLLLLYISERNFSENILAVIFAAFALRDAVEELTLRFERPPASEESGVAHHIEALLPAFAKRYGLTPREQEILALVLQGKDNQNIANELHLALGTVKTHTHNIFRKTGQASRTNLMRAFWGQ